METSTQSVPICGVPKIFTLQRGFVTIPPSSTSLLPIVWICCALVPCSSPRFTQIRCERGQSEAACQGDGSQRENQSDRNSEATQSIHDWIRGEAYQTQPKTPKESINEIVRQNPRQLVMLLNWTRRWSEWKRRISRRASIVFLLCYVLLLERNGKGWKEFLVG